VASVKAIGLEAKEDWKATPGHQSPAIIINHEPNEYTENHPATQRLIARFGMSETWANLVAQLAFGERSI